MKNAWASSILDLCRAANETRPKFAISTISQPLASCLRCRGLARVSGVFLARPRIMRPRGQAPPHRPPASVSTQAGCCMAMSPAGTSLLATVRHQRQFEPVPLPLVSADVHGHALGSGNAIPVVIRGRWGTDRVAGITRQNGGFPIDYHASLMYNQLYARAL